LSLRFRYVVSGFRLRVKLRRTAGVPNAAAALGWPAVASAKAVSRTGKVRLKSL